MDIPARRTSQTTVDAVGLSTPATLGYWLRWLYLKMFVVPWWGIILLAVAIFVYTRILLLTTLLPVPDSLYPAATQAVADRIVTANPNWSNAFVKLTEGVSLTLRVAFFSYAGALGVGLLLGLIRSSPPKPATGFFGVLFSLVKLAIYHIASVFVEVMRGMPLLTTIVIFAFAIIPAVKDYVEATYGIVIAFRSTSVETAVIVLALAYGAFMSETFRAGIQSIEKGQLEASRALGLNYFKTMRHVVLPQALRRILPPLGNDLVSMIKDSALVSVLGLRDITQVAKVTSGSNFQYVETYLTAAVIYLTLTIVLSLVVKYIERRMKTASR